MKLALFTVLLFWMPALPSNGSEALLYDDSNPSNLVVVVAGYQVSGKHPSGVEMSWFSLNPDAGAGDETGILFYILAPTNYAGRFFWVEVPRGYGSFEDQQMPSQKAYPKGQLFSFKFENDNIRHMLDTQSCLVPNERLTTWHLGTSPYFTRLGDAVAFVESNKTKLIQCERVLPKLKERLADAKQRDLRLNGGKTSPECRKLANDVGKTMSDIEWFKTCIRETEEQIERLTKMEQKMKAVNNPTP